MNFIKKIQFNSGIKHYLISFLILCVTALICYPFSNTPNYYVVSFIFLFVVSTLAVFMSIGPVVFSSTLSAIVWNYFFIPPHFTFHIDKTEDVMMVIMFFIIAVISGIMTTRIRKQEQIALEREKKANALFRLTKGLSEAHGLEAVLSSAIENINRQFATNCIIFMQDGSNNLLTSEKYQKPNEKPLALFESAEIVFKEELPSSFSIDSEKYSHKFYKLTGTTISPGVIAIESGHNWQNDQKMIFDTYLVLISNALERELLAEKVRKAEILEESDKLYKTLFNSISHEFRIPVATILGATDSLLSSTLPANMTNDLHQEIFMASCRLNRLIENLLNMTRLESGRLTIRLDWNDINDLVYKVSEDLSEELKHFKFTVTTDENLPLVKVDFGLMEQVLYNLIYNSCQHSPVGSAIDLYVSFYNNELVIEVADNGPGFPEDALENLFRKFYRVGGTNKAGLGLGLSIAKGFVEAHGGSICAENLPTGGAKFTLKIPSESPNIENISLFQV
jgi:K+-sensing histidine kinase KdpD